MAPFFSLIVITRRLSNIVKPTVGVRMLCFLIKKCVWRLIKLTLSHYGLLGQVSYDEIFGKLVFDNEGTGRLFEDAPSKLNQDLIYYLR